MQSKVAEVSNGHQWEDKHVYKCYRSILYCNLLIVGLWVTNF